MVTGGVTDVFQIVVLAAGTHAFLRGRCAGIRTLVEAEEHVLELVHPGVGEQQGRIVVRHERTGSHDLVALGFKELEELLADFGAFHRFRPLRRADFKDRGFYHRKPPAHLAETPTRRRQDRSHRVPACSPVLRWKPVARTDTPGRRGTRGESENHAALRFPLPRR